MESINTFWPYMPLRLSLRRPSVTLLVRSSKRNTKTRLLAKQKLVAAGGSPESETGELLGPTPHSYSGKEPSRTDRRWRCCGWMLIAERPTKGSSRPDTVIRCRRDRPQSGPTIHRPIRGSRKGSPRRYVSCRQATPEAIARVLEVTMQDKVLSAHAMAVSVRPSCPYNRRR